MPHTISLPNGYEISDDKSRLDLDALHAYLSGESYWAKGRPRALLERSIANSLCFGLYAPTGNLVGFARLVTDMTTSGHLCDVYVLDSHRGQNLRKALVAAVLNHPDLQTITRFSLSTRDAHGLYASFGFGPHPEVDTQMWYLVQRS